MRLLHSKLGCGGFKRADEQRELVEKHTNGASHMGKRSERSKFRRHSSAATGKSNPIRRRNQSVPGSCMLSLVGFPC